MDSVLQSLKISPLTRALTKNNETLDKFIYKMGKSSIPISKNKYRLPFPDTSNFGKKVRFKLHRIGILDSLILKFAFNIGKNATPATKTKDTVPKKGGALNAIKSVAITDGKQSLCKIDKNYILYWLSKQPYKKQLIYGEGMSMGGCLPNKWDFDGKPVYTTNTSIHSLNGDQGTGGFNQSWVYLPFPSCDSIGSYLDLSLLDQVYLEVEFDTQEEMGINYSIDNMYSYLQVHYLNMNPEHYESYQKTQYKENLNFVLQDQWILDDVKHEVSNVAGSTLVPVNIDIPCNKLIKQILIRATASIQDNSIENNLALLGCSGTESIIKVAIHMNGSEWMSWDGFELMLRRAKDETFGPLINKWNKGHKDWRKRLSGINIGIEQAADKGISVDTTTPDTGNAVNKVVQDSDHIDGAHYYAEAGGDYLDLNYDRPTTHTVNQIHENDFFVLDFTMPKFSKNYNCPFGGGVLFSATSNPYLEITIANHTGVKKTVNYMVHTSCIHYNVWSVNKNSGQILVANNR